MRLTIRDLVVALVGCRDRKMETIRQGIRDVEKHAKDIEQAAGSPEEQVQGANPPGN